MSTDLWCEFKPGVRVKAKQNRAALAEHVTFGTIESLHGDTARVRLHINDKRVVQVDCHDLQAVPVGKPYQNALDCQDACNLSGVAHSLSRDLEAIWDEVRANGGGTAQVNRHPAVQLYVAKLTELAGVTGGSCSEEYGQAFQVCTQMAGAPTCPRCASTYVVNFPDSGVFICKLCGCEWKAVAP